MFLFFKFFFFFNGDIMGYLLGFETDSHCSPGWGHRGEPSVCVSLRSEPQAVWATGLSHQAGLFITIEKACIEGHLVSFSGKGIVIFPVVLLDIIKTKPNNSAGLWESRVSLERAGHKDPSSEWSCFHLFQSLLLFKVQRSSSKPERIPFLSLSNRSDPRT